MLDRFTHTNSKGEVLDFVAYGIYINYNNLRDYEWKPTNSNNQIIGFDRGIQKKKLPLVFLVRQNNADTIKNDFYQHFDIDILSKQYGYFTINDYRLYCYITKSNKKEYLVQDNYLKIELEVTTDRPYWIKRITRNIDFSKPLRETKEMKYPFKYSYVYSSNSAVLQNDDFIESNGIIRIYGEVANPVVRLNQNIYQVDVAIGKEEYLEINTGNKTIFKYDKVGNRQNLFNYRNKKYDCFAKIPKGQIVVSSTAQIVDIEIEERRSEPKWNSSTRIQTELNSVFYRM